MKPILWGTANPNQVINKRLGTVLETLFKPF